MTAKIGLVFGRFNLIHPGHFRLFRFAKNFCDVLCAGLENNETSQDLRPYSDRERDLNAISLIDTVVGYACIAELLEDVTPDIIVRGHEFSSTSHDEEDALKASDIKVVFMSADERYDVKTLQLEIPRPTEVYEQEFKDRHNISLANIDRNFSSADKIKGLVCGEIIIDEYIESVPVGMSQEDKNVVYSIGDSERFLGGAGIVAAHCAGLGADVHILSVMGDDEDSRFARKKLDSFGVSADLIIEQSRRSIRKSRFIWQDRPIFRASHVDSHIIDDETKSTFFNIFSEKCALLNFVILSDFNYGVLPNDLVSELIRIAREKKTFIAADCQMSSQAGDLKKYTGVDLICPTEFEARSALKDFDSGVAYLGQKLRDELQVNSVILTLGASGLLIFSSSEGPYSVERLMPFSSQAVDVSGAGDSLLAAVTHSLVAGLDLFSAAYLGSLAAGIQVSRRGNWPLQSRFWRTEITD